MYIYIICIYIYIYIYVYLSYCILLQCYKSSNAINADVLHSIYISRVASFSVYIQIPIIYYKYKQTYINICLCTPAYIYDIYNRNIYIYSTADIYKYISETHI